MKNLITLVVVALAMLVIMDTFIGLTLDSGEHTIEFEYIPRGFTSGMCVSMLSIALLGYAIYSERKKRVNKN